MINCIHLYSGQIHNSRIPKSVSTLLMQKQIRTKVLIAPSFDHWWIAAGGYGWNILLQRAHTATIMPLWKIYLSGNVLDAALAEPFVTHLQLIQSDMKSGTTYPMSNMTSDITFKLSSFSTYDPIRHLIWPFKVIVFLFRFFLKHQYPDFQACSCSFPSHL